jgi:hypothetical protein
MFKRVFILLVFSLGTLASLSPRVVSTASAQDPAAQKPAAETADEAPDAETSQDDKLQQLADEKANVLESIDRLPATPTAGERADEVDPVFDRLVELRGEFHDHFSRAIADAKAAERPVSRAQEAVEAKLTRLGVEQSRKDQLEGSNIWKERVAAAEEELAQEERTLERAIDTLDVRRQRVRQYRSHLSFFADTLEPMLERISAERRAQFFALADRSNWQTAVDGLHNGVRALSEGADERWEQLRGVDLSFAEFWAWIWGLIWRLAVWLVLVKLVLPLIPPLTDSMLQRRFFRRHATLTIKIAELLRAVAGPVIFLVGVEYVATYLAQRFVEFQALVWIIDAVFVYWVVVAATKVLALPRSYRRQLGHASATPLEHIDEDEAAAVADLWVVELARARKLVRSVRAVTIFWLLSAYVPDFVRPVTGITVIWWLVDLVAVWGFVGVVYWVLSQWKDDIAALFERLAGDGLRGTVAFVNAQKDRPWGVLVIAVASLYVIFKEAGILARHLVRRTQWFKRASALAFRTKIEMQARDRLEKDGGAPLSASHGLPDDFLALFEDRPLSDEPYLIERTADRQQTLARFDMWTDSRRQGSVAVTGDPGVGKSTFLNGLREDLGDVTDLPVLYERIDDKLLRDTDVLCFLGALFGLEAPEATKDELIAQIDALEPRVILLDDCHNAFVRQIEGFDSFETLLDIVHLCDEKHFFVLSFNQFTWNYVNRIDPRQHYFGEVIRLEPFSENELEELIEKRTTQTGYTTSFADLVHGEADHEDFFLEVVRTANGYFRYLHEFCGGNPRVAILYWLRSLRRAGDTESVAVSLFRRPSTKGFSNYTDDHWFVLGALAQHGALDADEVAQVVNVSAGFCSLALSHFAEQDVVDIDPLSRRARLTPLYMRQVIKHLSNSNFLYG